MQLLLSAGGEGLGARKGGEERRREELLPRTPN